MSSFGDLNRVNTNIQSMDSQLSLNRINRGLAENQLRMSTGLRINRAEDDAAGYSIATKLSSRVSGLNQALQNVGDAKSILDIAESSFDTIMDNLIEMKGLVTQAANETLGETERGYIGQQITALGEDINDIANQTVFQDFDLLNGVEGGFTGSLNLTFQVGEREDDILTTKIDAVNVNELFSDSEAVVNAETEDAGTAFNIGAGTTAESVAVTVDGVTTSVALDGGTYSGTAGAADFENIADTINSLGIDGLTAEAVDTTDDGAFDDITFTNTNATGVSIQLVDDDGADIAGAKVDVDAATTNAEGQGAMDLQSFDANAYRNFIADIDSAIDSMSGRVNDIGIAQSSLSVREVTLSQGISANQSAISRIMDTDFAKEQSESIRLQILQQTATSALAQANLGPQSVLGFLG